MKDDNEDDLKNKEDLHIGGRHTAPDIFRFAVFFFLSLNLDWGAKINYRSLPLLFYSSLLWLTTQPILNHVLIKGRLYRAILYKGT